MSKAIPTSYPPVTDAGFEEFNQFAETGDWREQHASKDGKVHVYDRVVEGTPVNSIKVVAKLDVDALQLYDTLHDADYRKVWDDNMVEGVNIEIIDQNNDVGYYAAKSPVMGVSARDFCNERSWRIREDQEYMIINHSVIHPKCPEKKGYVRANSIKSGFIARRDPSGTGCTMTYITQSDPKGAIPSFVMNTITKTFAPKIVTKMEKAAHDYPAWRAKHGVTTNPWRDGSLKVGFAPGFE